MSAAVRVKQGDGYFVVTAPDGRSTAFKRHDQALDFADLVLRQQKTAQATDLAKLPSFRIRERSRPPAGTAYEVVDRDGKVVASLSSRDLALNKIDELARRERIRRRPCLTCGTTFDSEGAHNRMCRDCRSRAAGAVAS